MSCRRRAARLRPARPTGLAPSPRSPESRRYPGARHGCWHVAGRGRRTPGRASRLSSARGRRSRRTCGLGAAGRSPPWRRTTGHSRQHGRAPTGCRCARPASTAGPQRTPRLGSPRSPRADSSCTAPVPVIVSDLFVRGAHTAVTGDAWVCWRAWKAVTPRRYAASPGVQVSLRRRFGGRPPWPGRLSCHSMIRRGVHTCVRPIVRSGAGICPRARYDDTVPTVTPR